jgi:glycosyltransferase involved in cell wall biosynthesis
MNLVKNSVAEVMSNPAEASPSIAGRTVNVLVYVHMRNIHRSTGAGRVARQLTEHVARRAGLNVHILADESDHRSVVDKVGQPWASFPCHLFTNDTSAQQRRWLLTHRPVAEDYWPEAQIVHCTGESYVPTSRSKLVVTVHDAAYFDRGAHSKTFSNWKQSLKWRILYATLSRKADVFHTVSHFSADRLGEIFPGIRSRLRVVHNAAPPIFFGPRWRLSEEFLRRAGLANKPYILFPGGLHYRKNADLVFRAWPVLSKRMPDLLLVVPGHCDPVLAVRASTMGPSVRLLGFVEDEELHALYGGAQVVWFPSRYEGFGMPVLEAMASGAPVVASNSTSIPEIAADAAMLVSPDSIEANVDALETVMGSSEIRASMIAQGKTRAEQFTWTASAARIHEIYSSLL